MTDFVSEAVEVSKAIGAPVKVTWSREDDMHHDNYRPASYSRFEAGLDANGWPVAWTNRVVSPSITNSSGQPPKNGIDRTSTEGSHDMGYGIPNKLVDYHWTEVGIPVTYWRAVGYTQGKIPLRCGVSFLLRIRACWACWNKSLKWRTGASRFRPEDSAASR
jgi:isoquinoline 1-oxidoreductase beta subunit